MYTGHDVPEGRNDGRGLLADSLLPVHVPVTRVRRDTADVATLELTPASAFVFVPGQFNMLYVFGLGEVAISLSGDPAQQSRIVHTVRVVGAFSRAITRLRRWPTPATGRRG